MATKPLAKSLTDSGWKAVVQKFKLKDTSLQKQLFLLGTFDDDEYDDRLKGLASVIQFASAVKKSKEAAAIPEVVKYLGLLISAAEAEQREVAKEKALAQKNAALDQKKAEVEAKQRDKEEDEEEAEEEEAEEEGEYSARLMAALLKLKSAKDLAYEFILCEAKPIGVMVAKKISPQHKAQLMKLTGGKRFYPLGSCTFVDGKYHFNMEEPVAGVARRIQESIKVYTGKKLPIVAGAESAEEDEELGGPVEAAAPPTLPKAELSKAPQVWQGTREIVAKNINALRNAVQAKFGDEPPEAIDEFNGSLDKLDTVVEKLDNRLADSLAKANAAKDLEARKTELKNSKTILAQYINYVKSEPLIAHIDTNPFGVKTNLKIILAGSLTNMAQAIG
jgi:hypothetical protein